MQSPSDDRPRPVDGSRRSFIAGAGAAAVAGLGLAACSSDGASTAAVADGAGPADAAASQVVAFAGERQAGVLREPMPAGIVAALDVTATDRDVVATTMQALSTEIALLMSDTAIEPVDPADEILPPADSGAVDDRTGTAGVAVTVAVGSSLFDDRFGLADLRPAELVPMPRFRNDFLVEPSRSHGDLLVTISAPSPQVAAFALHQIVRITERRMRVRWVQEGFNQLLAGRDRPDGLAPSRNLMGFRDGTSNLDTGDAAEMDRHVWVQSGDDEPDWVVGGTYQAVRLIRMLIEFWATAALVRQEQIFGRHRDTGAPLGQSDESDEPAFALEPSDDTVPRRSHMRLANPRTPGTGRILRRGFSFLNGADAEGRLDQGLLFLCYQRSLRTGFLEVQGRLNGEPLEDYVKPVGGGLYFVLPGPGRGSGGDAGWLGRSLFEA